MISLFRHASIDRQDVASNDAHGHMLSAQEAAIARRAVRDRR